MSTRGFQSSAGSANNRQAHLANAYQELGSELCSASLKVVGGYTLGRVIGEGTFGSVHLATHRLTGTRCAVKKIPKNLTSQVTREIHHHRRLHHLHIVQLYEIIATETHVWLVTELCSGGELFDYLVEKGRMLEGEARRLFGELAVAVGHMHKEGVVHRDLKLENVLLDGELRIKLGDLGFAREWQKGKLMETYCGTTGYASPEMLAGQKYLGVETDLWSLGIILYILLCGGLPFDSDDDREMREMILKGEYDKPEWMSEAAKNLISQLLQRDPASRLSIEGILSHPWFKITITDQLPHSHSVPPSPMPDTGNDSAMESDFETRRASVGEGSGSGAVTPNEGDIRRIHSGEFSQTERALEMLHSNHLSERTVSFDDSSLQLPIASNSRTPSRTKRRSVSSTMSLERRASTSGTTFLPVDYLSILQSERVPTFTSAPEKRLLTQLSDLGFDTGQLIHSVETNACDSSSASWWILRAKQIERGDDDWETTWRHRPSTKKKERSGIAFDDHKDSKQRTREHSRDVSPGETPTPRAALTTSTSMPSLAPPIVTVPPPMPILRQPEPSQPSTPTRDQRSSELTPDGSPRDKAKTRSPSMSMLQRATSAFLGKSEGKEGDREREKEKHEDPVSSPNKLQKNGQWKKPEVGVIEHDEDKKKRESMWTSWSSFRQFFNDSSQKKKRDDKPTLVLSRGIAARAPHANRIVASSVSRRASVDRPVLYSRRSSSVNSRRSSISIIHESIVHEPVGRINSADGLPLYRRSSQRSHGSQTPTSDREFEYPSRPDSAHSRRRDNRGALTRDMRSPSMQSDGSGRLRAPPSPLHNYQRRTPQGTASTRIRHIRVIPESQLLRSNSVASSNHSNPSSRASSIHEDDDSVHSTRSGRRIRRDESLAKQMHRKGSPLVQFKIRPKKHKALLRDVFQNDEEWVDEDEHRFAGGLGQGRGNGKANGNGNGDSSQAVWMNGQRASLVTAASAAAMTPRKAKRDKKRTDAVLPEDLTSSASMGTGRRGIPPSRAQPGIIEEEEEEEES